MSENTQGKLSDFDVNSDLSSNVSGTSVDFFTKFNIHGGWKSLLLFQFQKQFSFTVIISVAVAYFVVLKDAVCALGTYQSWWIEKDYSHIRLRKSI